MLGHRSGRCKMRLHSRKRSEVRIAFDSADACEDCCQRRSTRSWNQPIRAAAHHEAATVIGREKFRLQRIAGFILEDPATLLHVDRLAVGNRFHGRCEYEQGVLVGS